MTTEELEAIRRRNDERGLATAADLGIAHLLAEAIGDVNDLLAEVARLTAALSGCRAGRERLIAEKGRLERENAGLREGR